MDDKEKIEQARLLMMDFARDTGLIDKSYPVKRYLWTDAFAVCNFLELSDKLHMKSYLDIALELVEQVHHTLGRHRKDDRRTGWISGLPEAEGEKHPTIGGLRIGKEENERMPDEPFNERKEWSRDGQYYHYLTKWMHALNRVSRVTDDPTYNHWAIELASTAHSKFSYKPSYSSQKRMYWKMSIDLAYPLVPTMGHHDPIDGYITYLQLQYLSKEFSAKSAKDLKDEISDMADICAGKDWTTTDPLGLGGLLWDINRLTQLVVHARLQKVSLIEELLGDARKGLEIYIDNNDLSRAAHYRLAFRELGLSTGMSGVKHAMTLISKSPGKFDKNHRIHEWIDLLIKYAPIIDEIVNFWLDTDHQDSTTWESHPDINRVMLATSLAPDSFLSVR